MSGIFTEFRIEKTNRRTPDPGRIGLASREQVMQERGDLNPKISLALSLRVGSITPCWFDGVGPRTMSAADAENPVHERTRVVGALEDPILSFTQSFLRRNQSLVRLDDELGVLAMG